MRQTKLHPFKAATEHDGALCVTKAAWHNIQIQTFSERLLGLCSFYRLSFSFSKYSSFSVINTSKEPLSGSVRSWGHLSASLWDEDDIQRLT